MSKSFGLRTVKVWLVWWLFYGDGTNLILHIKCCAFYLLLKKTWLLMKINIPLKFLLTCSCSYIHINKLSLPPFLSFSRLFERSGLQYLCVSKNLLISKSFVMFTSKCVSLSDQKCGLLFCAWSMISTPSCWLKLQLTINKQEAVFTSHSSAMYTCCFDNYTLLTVVVSVISQWFGLCMSKESS